VAVFISDEQTKETDENVGYLFFYRHSGGVLSQSPVRDGMSVKKQIVLPKEGVSQKPRFVIANEVKQSGKGW
jgi:hypothetical protein